MGLRYRTPHDGWHRLAVQVRRLRLRFDGPESIFVVVRDTKQEKHKLSAGRAGRRAAACKDTADFSSALITAATGGRSS
ncbi:hypothetical protein PV410_25020 [Streptomyces sp. PA03-5A]|nr:hypothetical protein [Streptomyces sp. PA03-5A]